MRFIIVLAIFHLLGQYDSAKTEFTMSIRKLITAIEPLTTPAPMRTLDPFIFCVYHCDYFPAGDGQMRAPRHGNGADFDPLAPYRMYHGDDIPGFPQHHHRGSLQH